MPGKKLYVGNLYCMARGYGYVEMNSVKEAVDAKKALDGADFLERVIRVRYADEPQYIV
jgi:RNA recognition motif-containing protein